MRTIGRPRGAKSIQRVQIEVTLSQCPRCGSCARTPYRNRRIEWAGHRFTEAGDSYSQVLYRDTQCRACGQARTERAAIVKPVEGQR